MPRYSSVSSGGQGFVSFRIACYASRDSVPAWGRSTVGILQGHSQGGGSFLVLLDGGGAFTFSLGVVFCLGHGEVVSIFWLVYCSVGEFRAVAFLLYRDDRYFVRCLVRFLYLGLYFLFQAFLRVCGMFSVSF